MARLSKEGTKRIRSMVVGEFPQNVGIGPMDIIDLLDTIDALEKELAAKPEAAPTASAREFFELHFGRDVVSERTIEAFTARDSALRALTMREAADACEAECTQRGQAQNEYEAGYDRGLEAAAQLILALSPGQKALDDYVAERVKAAVLAECSEIQNKWAITEDLDTYKHFSEWLWKRLAALRSSGEAASMQKPGDLRGTVLDGFGAQAGEAGEEGTGK